MRVSAQGKEEIIHLADRSELGVNKTLKEPGIHKSTFYNWYRAYLKKESEGPAPVRRPPGNGTPSLRSSGKWWWKRPWSILCFPHGNWP